MTVNASDQAIMDALAKRLSVSVRNLCDTLAVSMDELKGRLETLQREGRIRIVHPVCAGHCSACSSCSDDRKAPEGITAETVVISLERAVRTQ
jgi:hypothetical protein